MDDKTLYEIKKLAEGIDGILQSEHAPFLRPVLHNMEIINETISGGFRELARNQQQVYDAVAASTKELTSQNEILRHQLNLAIAQNRLLIEALRHLVPLRFVESSPYQTAESTVLEAIADGGDQLAAQSTSPFKV